MDDVLAFELMVYSGMSHLCCDPQGFGVESGVPFHWACYTLDFIDTLNTCTMNIGNWPETSWRLVRVMASFTYYQALAFHLSLQSVDDSHL